MTILQQKINSMFQAKDVKEIHRSPKQSGPKG